MQQTPVLMQTLRAISKQCNSKPLDEAPVIPMPPKPPDQVVYNYLGTTNTSGDKSEATTAPTIHPLSTMAQGAQMELHHPVALTGTLQSPSYGHEISPFFAPMCKNTQCMAQPQMQQPSALDHSFSSTGVQKIYCFDKATTTKPMLSQAQWHKWQESAGAMQV